MARADALKRLAQNIEVIPAEALFSVLRSPDVRPGQTLEELWARTRKENTKAFLDSIRKSGVENPIRVNQNWLVDGRHRLLGAMDVDPSMLVPVQRNVGFNPMDYSVRPANANEKLFSEYLASSLFGEGASPAQIQKLLDQYGYAGLLRSASDNDPGWLDFRDAWRGVLL